MYWLSTKKAKIIMLLPTLMIYAVFIIVPVFIACYYSFTDYSGLGKASFVGIKNYVAMFHDKLFLIALKNTFLVLLFSVIFLIVGSFMAALLMNKNFHGNAFFKMVIFAPYVIAPIIIGDRWNEMVSIVIGDRIHMAGTGFPWNYFFIRNQSNTGRYLRSL